MPGYNMTVWQGTGPAEMTAGCCSSIGHAVSPSCPSANCMAVDASVRCGPSGSLPSTPTPTPGPTPYCQYSCIDNFEAGPSGQMNEGELSQDICLHHPMNLPKNSMGCQGFNGASCYLTNPGGGGTQAMCGNPPPSTPPPGTPTPVPTAVPTPACHPDGWTTGMWGGAEDDFCTANSSYGPGISTLPHEPDPPATRCCSGVHSPTYGYGDRVGGGNCYWRCGTSTTSATPPPMVTNGACGSDTTVDLWAPPTNLCSAGTPSAVSGNSPWTWTCAGAYGGTTATCTANPDGCSAAAAIWQEQDSGNGACTVNVPGPYTSVDHNSGVCPSRFTYSTFGVPGRGCGPGNIEKEYRCTCP